jgi:hypothetical protein
MRPGSKDGPSRAFFFAGTTIRVKPEVLLNLAGLGAGLAWWTRRRRPAWGRWTCWLAGLLDMVVLGGGVREVHADDH